MRETGKFHPLSEAQRIALNKILDDLLGSEGRTNSVDPAFHAFLNGEIDIVDIGMFRFQRYESDNFEYTSCPNDHPTAGTFATGSIKKQFTLLT